MFISLIAAMDQNRVLGKDGKMPWHLPADLQHFKAITLQKPIIMGRKTFDSIGRALPRRRNIVVTRQSNWHQAGVEVVNSLQQALALVEDHEEVMVIGGGELYRQALPLATRLYLTLIDAAFAGDVTFPAWNAADWEITQQQQAEDQEQGITFRFVQMDRKKPR